MRFIEVDEYEKILKDYKVRFPLTFEHYKHYRNQCNWTTSIVVHVNMYPEVLFKFKQDKVDFFSFGGYIEFKNCADAIYLKMSLSK